MLVSASFGFIIADNLYSSELDRLLIEPNFYLFPVLVNISIAQILIVELEDLRERKTI